MWGGRGDYIPIATATPLPPESELRNCVKVEVAVLLKGRQSLDKNLLKNYRPISICPKSLKKSFSTNFSPISKKATPFSQPIEQDTERRLLCYVNDILSALDNNICSSLVESLCSF